MSELSKHSLTKLAELANKSADVAETHAANAVSHAIQAGHALLAAKAKCDHGMFSKWLSENFDRTERTAQRFMKLAQGNASIENADVQSVKQALSAITESRLQAADGAPPICAKTDKRVGFEDENPTKKAPSANPRPEQGGVVQGEIVDDSEDEEEDETEVLSRPTSAPPVVDQAAERARRMVPDLCRSLAFQLGNLGANGRFDSYIDEMKEFAR